MKSVCIILNIKDHTVNSNEKNIIKYLYKVTPSITVFIVNQNKDNLQSQLEKSGVQRIINLIYPNLIHQPNPEVQACILSEAIQKFSYQTVFAATDESTMQLLPRVATHLQAPLEMGVTELKMTETEYILSKPLFANRAITSLSYDSTHHVISLKPPPSELEVSKTSSEWINVHSSEVKSKLQYLDHQRYDLEIPDLCEAEIILSGGRAMKSRKNFSLLFECAHKLGAAVGASRAAVDLGYADANRQIGLTGKTVSPSLYIACGISGSVQHLAGMKHSKKIIAINTDTEAPMMKYCDIAIQGDLYEILPKLIQDLKLHL